MFRAHQENNIVAPRGELTTPGPLLFTAGSRGEGRKRLLQGRNPRCHRLSAALNTRWFIHEGSLTAITLIRLINGCRQRGVVLPPSPTGTYNVIQTDNISWRLTLPRRGLLFSALFHTGTKANRTLSISANRNPDPLRPFGPQE